MEIVVGKNAGFCYGVAHAVNGAIEEARKSNRICCLGEIVHNQSVVDNLEKIGVKFINDISDATENVIIRAHGATKQIYEEAKRRNIKIKDFTCPNVLKIHKIADEYQKKGYFIILIGKENHPEVIGIASFCGNNMFIIEDEKNIGEAVNQIMGSNINDIVIISQTTYDLNKFELIVQKLKKLVSKNIIVKKTICPATEIRQIETEDMSKKVDAMIIIGDKKSSNTNKLYNISCKNCKKVMFIQNEKELEIENLKTIKKIGIMAGASTPREDIEKVLKILKEEFKYE